MHHAIKVKSRLRLINCRHEWKTISPETIMTIYKTL